MVLVLAGLAAVLLGVRFLFLPLSVFFFCFLFKFYM